MKTLCTVKVFIRVLHKDDESEFSSSETDWEAPVQKEIPLERDGIIKTIKLDAAEYKNKLKLGNKLGLSCAKLRTAFVSYLLTNGKLDHEYNMTLSLQR